MLTSMIVAVLIFTLPLIYVVVQVRNKRRAHQEELERIQEELRRRGHGQ